MKHLILKTLCLGVLSALGGFATTAGAQEVLPFPALD